MEKELFRMFLVSSHLATLSADAVNAVMTVYINRGSCPKSFLLNVQCSVTELSSLPHEVRTSTLIYGATFILLMKTILISVCEHPHWNTVQGSLAE